MMQEHAENHIYVCESIGPVHAYLINCNHMMSTQPIISWPCFQLSTHSFDILGNFIQDE